MTLSRRDLLIGSAATAAVAAMPAVAIASEWAPRSRVQHYLGHVEEMHLWDRYGLVRRSHGAPRLPHEAEFTDFNSLYWHRVAENEIYVQSQRRQGRAV